MKFQNIKLLVLATLVIFSGCGDDDVTIVNLSPEIANQSFSASETIDDETVIGVVQATDPEGEGLTFSISNNIVCYIFQCVRYHIISYFNMFRATSPGNFFPSINSSNAPPPVET